MRLTCCPTSGSTGTSPHLAVPVRYEALKPLQFYVFSVFLRFLRSKRQRVFLDFSERYAHQFFGKSVSFGGGYENATTFLAWDQDSMTRPNV